MTFNLPSTLLNQPLAASLSKIQAIQPIHALVKMLQELDIDALKVAIECLSKLMLNGTDKNFVVIIGLSALPRSMSEGHLRQQCNWAIVATT